MTTVYPPLHLDVCFRFKLQVPLTGVLAIFVLKSPVAAGITSNARYFFGPLRPFPLSSSGKTNRSSSMLIVIAVTRPTTETSSGKR